jgi:hypothetical protein
MSSAPSPQSDADQLEAAADQAIAACGGDAREAVKALIVANQFLETDLEKLKAAVSMGYARGKLFEPVPRDQKDWYLAASEEPLSFWLWLFFRDRCSSCETNCRIIDEKRPVCFPHRIFAVIVYRSYGKIN